MKAMIQPILELLWDLVFLEDFFRLTISMHGLGL